MNSLYESKDILRLFCEDCGAVTGEEVSAAEAPQHRDARQAGIRGRLKVHVGIPDIDCLLFLHAKSVQSLYHHIRSWLSRDFWLLAYGDVYHTAEERPSKLVDALLQLVTDHRHTITL